MLLKADNVPQVHTFGIGEGGKARSNSGGAGGGGGEGAWPPL